MDYQGASSEELFREAETRGLYPMTIELRRPNGDVVMHHTVHKRGDPPPAPYYGNLQGADRLVIHWGNGDVDEHLFVDSAEVPAPPGSVLVPDGRYIPPPAGWTYGPVIS